MAEMEKLNLNALENAAGGNDGASPMDEVHNLAYFAEHVVDHLPAGTCLVMKYTHETNGSVMPGHQFKNGDRIWIHSRYWEGGHFLAYHNGEFGYVDAQYVR